MLFVALAVVLLAAPGEPPAAVSGWTSVASVPDERLRTDYSVFKAGEGPFAPARAAAEDWPGAQRRARDPRWAHWLDGQRGKLDAWIAAGREHAEQSAGWLHDYVDASTGAFLPWSPETPMPPGDAAHARQRGGWLAHVRFHNIDEVLEAARFFRLGAGQRYADWAASQLDAYADQYARLPLKTWNGNARLLTQSLDEAIAAIKLADAARLLDATPARRAHWRDGLFLPIAGNLVSSKRGEHNIALWHAVAIAVIGLEFDQRDLLAEGLDSRYGVRQLLARNVSGDYFWAEMSLSYQNYVIEALDELLLAASLRGKLGELRRELWLTQDMLLAELGVMFPDGSSPTLNDSPPNRKTLEQPLWTRVRRTLPTTEALARSARLLDWGNLLDPLPAPPTRPPAIAPRSQVVPGLDAVQIDDGAWHALLRFGTRLPTHAQQESLTYEAQYRGVWVLRDDGVVGYGSPLYQGFFTRAAAQNVPLIDFDGQRPVPGAGALAAFNDGSSGVPRAAAVHEDYQPGVSASRALSLESGRLLDRVHITAPAEHSLGLVFNFDCPIEAGGGLEPRGQSTLPAGPFGHWRESLQFEARSNWSARLRCPGRTFLIEVSGPARQQVDIGRAPSSVKPYFRTGLLIRTQARAADWTVAFKPD